MLAAAVFRHEDELRADLQQTYGIDLDHAMAGEHSALHIAALTAQLPHESRVFASMNRDAVWTLEGTLLATIANSLNSLCYGMSDKRKRGNPPAIIGPSWMSKDKMRTLPARAMSVDDLQKELEKPRS